MLKTLHLFAVALLACWLFATSANADTYAAWKARNFSTQEQADPTISGENANPAGDGIINLMKYALAIDPHQNGTAQLPTVTNDGYYLYLTYRVPADAPTDLYVFPEVSPDLHIWHRGPNAVKFNSNYYDNDGTLLNVYHAISPIFDNPTLFMHLQVLAGEVLPTSWQLQYFGHTGVDPNADADGDGISNFDEYLEESDPTNIYDPVPIVSVYSGGQQGGAVNQFVPQPLVVKVTNIRNQPILNAPVQFAVASGGGQLSTAMSGQPLTPTLNVVTNASGLAQVYYQQGPNAPVASDITAQAVNAGYTSNALHFTTSTANPPVITVLSPQQGATSSTSVVGVSIQVTSDAALDEVRINSILVKPSDGQGHYSQSLTLSEGPQTITIRAKSIYNMVTTQQVAITVSSQPANLTILRPADGQVFSTQHAYMRVRAESNQVTVSVNGLAATKLGSAAYTFGIWVPINAGANTITATLTDANNRQSSDSVTVQCTLAPGYNPNGDDDGDGVINSQDLFPYDPYNSTDSDNDGVGDGDDPNPNDPTVDGGITITYPPDGLYINAQ